MPEGRLQRTRNAYPGPDQAAELLEFITRWRAGLVAAEAAHDARMARLRLVDRRSFEHPSFSEASGHER